MEPDGNIGRRYGKAVVRSLDAACDSSMPRRKPSRRGSPCYWWNDQIAQLRKACLRARRCSQRARRRPDFEDRLEDLRAAKRALKCAIKASKSSCFTQICEEADVNPADLGKGGGEQQVSPEETLSTVQALRSASQCHMTQPCTSGDGQRCTSGRDKEGGKTGIPSYLTSSVGLGYQWTMDASADTKGGGMAEQRKYLHKYRHDDSPECPTCPSASEDPEHVLYYCTRYRGRAGVVPPPESLMAFMLATEDN
ncbi:hypothetical protein ACLKA7_014752 [Drosophila subpalustris]